MATCFCPRAGMATATAVVARASPTGSSIGPVEDRVGAVRPRGEERRAVHWMTFDEGYGGKPESLREFTARHQSWGKRPRNGSTCCSNGPRNCATNLGGCTGSTTAIKALPCGRSNTSCSTPRRRRPARRPAAPARRATRADEGRREVLPLERSRRHAGRNTAVGRAVASSCRTPVPRPEDRTGAGPLRRPQVRRPDPASAGAPA